MTRNVKHFVGLGVRVVDPFAERSERKLRGDNVIEPEPSFCFGSVAEHFRLLFLPR